MRIIALFATLLSLTFSISVHAQTFGGVGTRAAGMGGAFVAVADDASAVYWNPAGIATGATFDLMVSKGPDSGLFIGAALPVLGASYYETREAAGLPTVSRSADRENGGSGKVPIPAFTTRNFGVTVVQTVAPGLVIGTTARVVSGGAEGFDRRTAGDLDAGAMMSVWHMKFGVTARNLTQPKFETGEGEIQLKRQFRIGAALTPRSLPTGVHGPFSLAFDADVTTTPDVRGDRRRAAAGGEYWLGKGLIGVRAGIGWSTLGERETAFSGGATLRLPRSLYVDGQMTKHSEPDAEEWTIAARITF